MGRAGKFIRSSEERVAAAPVVLTVPSDRPRHPNGRYMRNQELIEAYRLLAEQTIAANKMLADERDERLMKEQELRDPARIPELVATLQQYMERYPDMRLAQVVSNASIVTNRQSDPFYMEDDKLLGYLQAELSRVKAVAQDTASEGNR